MYSIRRQFIKFYSTCEFSVKLLKSLDFDNKTKFIFSSGILNCLWQTWGQLWRTLWLAHILGGESLQRNHVPPYRVNISEEEGIWYLLFLLGRRNTPHGAIVGSHQEPTWGDKDVIEDIALQIKNRNISSVGDRTLSAFNVLGDTPKHFQIVRNAAIHLNKQGYQNVRGIIPHYVIATLDYPTDILFCNELRTGKIAYQYWLEDLITVIELVCT